MQTQRCFTHQNGDDAFVLLFYQVTNDLVVKVLHSFPLHVKGKNVVLASKFDINSCFTLTTQLAAVLTAIPSVSYSSCSDLRVSSINSCWSFSLQ